jgi:hypothetical protein
MIARDERAGWPSIFLTSSILISRRRAAGRAEAVPGWASTVADRLVHWTTSCAGGPTGAATASCSSCPRSARVVAPDGAAVARALRERYADVAKFDDVWGRGSRAGRRRGGRRRRAPPWCAPAQNELARKSSRSPLARRVRRRLWLPLARRRAHFQITRRSPRLTRTIPSAAARPPPSAPVIGAALEARRRRPVQRVRSIRAG